MTRLPLPWSLPHLKMCFLFVVHFIICADKRFVDVTLAVLFVKSDNKLLPVQECQSLTLHSFLMLPMQRITRYAPFNFYIFCVLFGRVFSSLFKVVHFVYEKKSTFRNEVLYEYILPARKT